MSQKRKKNTRTTEAGADPGVLQAGRGNKKLTPLARRLLYAAVILVAAAQVLDTMLQVISRTAGDIMTAAGGLLLVVFLVVQGRSGGAEKEHRR